MKEIRICSFRIGCRDPVSRVKICYSVSTFVGVGLMYCIPLLWLLRGRGHQMIVRPCSFSFGNSVSIAETSWQAVWPGPSLCALQLLFSCVDVACIALDQNSITNFIEEFDRSNSAIFGVAWKPTSTFTKWWGVRPKPCLCASDDRLSNEYVSLMAAVLHCISHQVMSVIHHVAIEWWQGWGARNCFAFWHIAGPLAIWTALDCFGTDQCITKWTEERGFTLEAVVQAQYT